MLIMIAKAMTTIDNYNKDRQKRLEADKYYSWTPLSHPFNILKAVDE
jgi:hypothetical protein